MSGTPMACEPMRWRICAASAATPWNCIIMTSAAKAASGAGCEPDDINAFPSLGSYGRTALQPRPQAETVVSQPVSAYSPLNLTTLAKIGLCHPSEREDVT